MSECVKCKNPSPSCFSLLSISQLPLHCFAFVLAELPASPYEHFEGAHCWYGEGAPDLPSV